MSALGRARKYDCTVKKFQTDLHKHSSLLNVLSFDFCPASKPRDIAFQSFWKLWGVPAGHAAELQTKFETIAKIR